MFRLLFLLLRQRLRESRVRVLPWIAGAAVVSGLAGTASYFNFGPAPGKTETASAKATLRLKVDAVGSAPLVVYLEPASMPNAGAPAVGTASITSVHAAFEPRFQVASVGTRLEVGNLDPIPHNTHLVEGRRTLFNVATPTAGAAARKLLTRPGIFEVRCDLHPWMRAWVFVPAGAHHAVLWNPGEVTLEGIAPGSYRLRVWQAGGESSRNLVIASGEVLQLVH